MPKVSLLTGDVRQVLAACPDDYFHCVVTSPPYWGLRAYGTEPQVWGGDGNECCRELGHLWGEPFCTRCGAWRGELGLEPTVELFVQHLVEVFREVRRVLRPDGTLWLNLGDSYAGSPNGRSAKATKAAGTDDRTFQDKPANTAVAGLKNKDLVGQPWRVALALQADGWWLRSDIIWHKPNPKPESIKDRPSVAHEYVFLLTKSARYYFDHEALREPATYGRREWKGASAHEMYDAGSKGQRLKQTTRGRQSYSATNGDQDNSGGFKSDEATRHGRTLWSINTQACREAHFATFPEKLVEKCLRGGGPLGGCCAACGKPRTRRVELGEPDAAHQAACGADASGGYEGTSTKDYATARAEDPSALKARILQGMKVRRSVGWDPACKCDAHTNLGRVLDPFAGSGTVGLVAARLGLECALVELQSEYVEIARKRLTTKGK